MKKLEQEIFSDKSKIFKWPPFFYIHRYTPNFFIKRLQIVYIFFFYMSPDWEGLRRGWIHPFFNKNVIFDENLWFFKNFFSLKMIKKQFPIHPSFQNKCLKSNSKIFKSHQIQPKYTVLLNFCSRTDWSGFCVTNEAVQVGQLEVLYMRRVWLHLRLYSMCWNYHFLMNTIMHSPHGKKICRKFRSLQGF